MVRSQPGQLQLDDLSAVLDQRNDLVQAFALHRPTVDLNQLVILLDSPGMVRGSYLFFLCQIMNMSAGIQTTALVHRDINFTTPPFSQYISQILGNEGQLSMII